MPKETEEEKAEKARVMAIVLKDACSVPMEIMEKCCEALDLIKFQNAYNLSSKMISVMAEVYDKLIEETGV